MCLSVPGKIVKIQGDMATVDYGVEQRNAQIIGSEFSVNDFVIVQGGICVQKIPPEEAIESLKLFQQAVKNG